MWRFTSSLVLLALLVFPVPGRADEGKKRVSAPKSDKTWIVEELGYLEGEDAFVHQEQGVYAFVVYTRKAKKGEPGKKKRELVIRSNLLTGLTITPERGKSLAAQLEEKGDAWRNWGGPFKPAGPDDARRIEYRFHQKDGKPEKISIYLVTRDEKRKAKEPKVLEVAWPFGKAEKKK